MLRSLSRASRSIMTTTPPRVPIPKNGVDYRGKIVLAPMVRSGELPSRLMALKYGADLVWGPETVDRSLIGATIRTNPRNQCIEYSRISTNGGRADLVVPAKENVIYRIDPKEKPCLIFQLGTANPDLAVQAATTVAPYVSGIDVNAGCPKPFSTSGGMGAALLSTPDLLCDILRALVKEVGEKFEIGISVKIRLLATEAETRSLVERLCQTGITGLTIHCRTRSMRKTERAIRDQLAMVGEVCRAAGVACLMNGDVETREQAETLVKDFGVDGAMIATAAEKNPSVFRVGGPVDWREIVTAYMDAAIDVENKWGNTKFLLAQMIPGKEQAKVGISQAKNYEDIVERLGIGEWVPDSKTETGKEESHEASEPTSEALERPAEISEQLSGTTSQTSNTPQLQSLQVRAAALDARLGITERLTKSEQKAIKRKEVNEHAERQQNGGQPGKRQRGQAGQQQNDGHSSKKQKKREKKLAELAAMGEKESAAELVQDGALEDVEGGDAHDEVVPPVRDAAPSAVMV